MTTRLSSREFNQDTSGAKKAAENGPVFITDRGRPTMRNSSDHTEHSTCSPSRQESRTSSSWRRRTPTWRNRQRSSDVRPGHERRVRAPQGAKRKGEPRGCLVGRAGLVGRTVHLRDHDPRARAWRVAHGACRSCPGITAPCMARPERGRCVQESSTPGGRASRASSGCLARTGSRAIPRCPHRRDRLGPRHDRRDPRPQGLPAFRRSRRHQSLELTKSSLPERSPSVATPDRRRTAVNGCHPTPGQ